MLFGSTNAHTDLRRKLVGEFNLLAVVSLPAELIREVLEIEKEITMGLTKLLNEVEPAG